MCERYTKEAINSIYRERDQSKECTKLENALRASWAIKPGGTKRSEGNIIRYEQVHELPNGN